MTEAMRLEATRKRREIWTECRTRHGKCGKCPYRYRCEEHFPTPGNDWSLPDIYPSQYELSTDGTIFYTSAV